jgi:hypothetical protein
MYIVLPGNIVMEIRAKMNKFVQSMAITTHVYAPHKQKKPLFKRRRIGRDACQVRLGRRGPLSRDLFMKI